jgi:hypothetical protein
MKTFLLVILLLLPADIYSQQRVRFKRGASSVTLRGVVKGEATDYYIFRARARQTLSVKLSPAYGRARVSVYAIKGQLLTEDASEWVGILPESNDYMIEVTSTSGRARYALSIIVH